MFAPMLVLLVLLTLLLSRNAAAQQPGGPENPSTLMRNSAPNPASTHTDAGPGADVAQQQARRAADQAYHLQQDSARLNELALRLQRAILLAETGPRPNSHEVAHLAVQVQRMSKRVQAELKPQ